MAFHNHAQVNPSGYVGSGRGLAPYPAASPAQSAEGPEKVTTGGQDRTVPPTPAPVAPVVNPGGLIARAPALTALPASTPLIKTLPTELGVGVSRIDRVGVLGIRF
jgi:hypothetical protein